MERTAMSRKEYDRWVVLARVERKELTLKGAAPLLRISYREYGKQRLQLDRAARGRVPAGSKVIVRETQNGKVRVIHVSRLRGERECRWTLAIPRTQKKPEPDRSRPPKGTPKAEAAGIRSLSCKLNVNTSSLRARVRRQLTRIRPEGGHFYFYLSGHFHFNVTQFANETLDSRGAEIYPANQARGTTVFTRVSNLAGRTLLRRVLGGCSARPGRSRGRWTRSRLEISRGSLNPRPWGEGKEKADLAVARTAPNGRDRNDSLEAGRSGNDPHTPPAELKPSDASCKHPGASLFSRTLLFRRRDFPLWLLLAQPSPGYFVPRAGPVRDGGKPWRTRRAHPCWGNRGGLQRARS